MYPALIRAGMMASQFGRLTFNPLVPEGTWTPGHADIELAHIFEDLVAVCNIERGSKSLASLMEMGACLLESMFSVKRLFVRLTEGSLDDLGDSALFARDMLQLALLDWMGGDTIAQCQTIDELAQRSYAALNSTTSMAVPTLPPVSRELAKFILVAGTSGSTLPEYRRYIESLAAGYPHLRWVDAWAAEGSVWSAILAEEAAKNTAAVNLFCITTDSHSYAGASEIPARIAKAYALGQQSVVYMEPWSRFFLGDTDDDRDARNARAYLSRYLPTLTRKRPGLVQYFIGPKESHLPLAVDASAKALSLYQ